jgi:hypothetical protein
VTAIDCIRGPLVEAARLAGAVIHVKRDELGAFSCSVRTLSDPLILRPGATAQQAMDGCEAELARLATRKAPDCSGASMAVV